MRIGRWGSSPPVAAVAQGRSRHPRRHGPLLTTRRMPAGLHGVAGSSPAPRKRVAQWVEHRSSSITSLPWTTSSWRMPDGLHRLLIAKSRVRVPPGLSWTRSSAGRAGPSVKHLVAMAIFEAGECRRDYIGKGRKAERFESAPERSGMSRQTSSPAPRPNVGECRRDYMGEHLPQSRRSAVRSRLRVSG